jgi:hypothetical protein
VSKLRNELCRWRGHFLFNSDHGADAGLQLARDPADALFAASAAFTAANLAALLSSSDGRPSVTPSAFARAMPDRTRSRLMARSNSAVWGYPFALFLIVLTTLLPLFWFKWKGWIFGATPERKGLSVSFRVAHPWQAF